MIWIQNDGPRLKLVGKVDLARGLNEVAADRWKACVGHQMTQVFLGTGMIRVVPGAELRSPDRPKEPETDQLPYTNVEEEEETPSEPAMSAKDLIAVVKASTDEAYLESLLGSEMRSTVRAAIIARLDARHFD